MLELVIIALTKGNLTYFFTTGHQLFFYSFFYHFCNYFIRTKWRTDFFLYSRSLKKTFFSFFFNYFAHLYIRYAVIPGHDELLINGGWGRGRGGRAGGGVEFFFLKYKQAHPQRMKLQRRLYRIEIVCFLTFIIPCDCKLRYFFSLLLYRP